MKKILLSLMLMAGSIPAAFAQSSSKPKSEVHTFVVDKDLPAPEKITLSTDGNKLAQALIRQESATKFVASSFNNDSLYCPGQATFYDCLVKAYAGHHPVVLSPDIIWLLISQGFSHYVNLDSESLRDKIVSFQGKQTLCVQTEEDLYSPNVNWEGLLMGFNQQIKKNTKEDLADMMTADFSTTGKTEYIASQITLMSTVKSYFDFIVFKMACGIPYITLEGTPDDWERVLTKAQSLRKYDLEWWVDDLTPILTEFVNASKGEVNTEFWQDIVVKNRHKDLDGGGCSGVKPTMLDGWFLKLMPWSKNGRTPSKVPYTYDNMLSEATSADFTYVILDYNGNPVKTVPMTMISGLVGIEVDNATTAMRPKIGWVVAENTNKAHCIISQAEWGYLIGNTVPEELKTVVYEESFTMRFTDDVVLPDWLDTLKIDHISFRGKISTDEAEKLKSRFPHRNVNILNIKEDEKIIVLDAKESYVPADYIYSRHSPDNRDFKIVEPSLVDSIPVYRFIEKNRRIPIAQHDDHISGHMVYLSYVVEKDGTVSNVKVYGKGKQVTQEQEEEAIRLINSLPKFTPAHRQPRKEGQLSVKEGNGPVRFLMNEEVRF